MQSRQHQVLCNRMEHTSFLDVFTGCDSASKALSSTAFEALKRDEFQTCQATRSQWTLISTVCYLAWVGRQLGTLHIWRRLRCSSPQPPSRTLCLECSNLNNENSTAVLAWLRTCMRLLSISGRHAPTASRQPLRMISPYASSTERRPAGICTTPQQSLHTCETPRFQWIFLVL